MAPPTAQVTVNYILKAYTEASVKKIAKDLKMSTTTVSKILKRNNVVIRSAAEQARIFAINENYFNSIDTEEKAYFLGFLFADGTVDGVSRVKISLKSIDEDILLKFSNIIYGFKKLTYANSTNGKTHVATLSFYSKQMLEDLERHGCVSAKTFLIRLPKLNDDMYRHFIRGYFDGDGCISFKKDGRTFIDITSNVRFIEDLRVFLLEKENIKVNKYISNRNSETACFQASGKNEVKTFLNYIYKNSTIYMDRKYNKYLICLQNDGRAPGIATNENEITLDT